MRPDSETLHKILGDEIGNYLKGLPDESLFDPIKYVLSLGGKRIRPMLVLIGSDVFRGDLKKALPAALAIEVFHNFTLVHDDIMDRAPLRRGKITVHEKWDENAAILSGDAMLIEAYKLLASIDPGYSTSVLDLFNTTSTEVCRGQQLDMDFEKRRDVTVDEYIEMISLKTAVLLGCSLKTGAMLADASEKDANEIYAFGKSLGIAFQLQDDYLDAFGDPDKFGKQSGGDIISDKKTFLIIRALEKADVELRKELERIFYQNSISESEEKVRRVLDIFRELKIDRETKNLCDSYFERAENHLMALSPGPFEKQGLREFLHNLRDRKV